MENGAKLREDEPGAPLALEVGVGGEDLVDAGDAVVDSLTGSLGHLRSASLTKKAVMASRTDAQPTSLRSFFLIYYSMNSYRISANSNQFFPFFEFNDF